MVRFKTLSTCYYKGFAKRISGLKFGGFVAEASADFVSGKTKMGGAPRS
jgi:hypothetical protein